ncbi:hypothetical protein NA57DRAFT_72337 [Rhizodiscina lignyota]|uniref:Zn(2)-C6 fungal-type domain-containing protein n=1 Tax=Rhizodiscina lignyota TaxID=1504668 RepID=A0A9P4MA60_9PEZI|nr:hypothetical protein NA57DRAFT_72337 [Rhizodiscina lignyota]
MTGPEIRFAKINISGERTRVRKQHAKSRTGCDSCKKRKIKCDEKIPICSACVRRKEECIRPRIPVVDDERHRDASTPASQTSSLGSLPRPATSPVPAVSSSLDINFLQLRLFHHFESVTVETLVLGFEAWKKVLPLAFEYEYLMHAILMMGAAHLSYLDPTNEIYKTAELEHLSNATQGIRTGLSSELSQSSAEALFASCILVYNQTWSSYEYTDSGVSESHNLQIDADFLLPLGAGLKGVISDTLIWVYIWRSSIFSECVAFSPKLSLNQCAQHTVYPEELSMSFVAEYLRLWPQIPEENSLSGADTSTVDSGNSDFVSYMTEVTRLIPVISVLKLGNCGIDLKPLETAIVRYLYSWPVLMGGALQMIKDKKDCVQLLFYHYYKAVEVGVPEKYWWAQKRKHMAKALENGLREKGIVPNNCFLEND